MRNNSFRRNLPNLSKNVTSSPLYPHSNGLAERNVQTVKRLLKKATDDKTEWQLALLNFRNTPITGEEYSPGQMLMGRSLNTRLPVAPKSLIPKAIEPKKVRNLRQGKIDNMKRYYDRGTKSLSTLSPGEEVRVKDGKVWNKARVVEKAEGDRSYWVKVDNGGTYRRNRSHILKPNIRTNMPKRVLSGSYDPIPDMNTGSQDTPPVGESAIRPQLRLIIPSTDKDSTSTEAAASATPSPKVTRSGREVGPPQKFAFK